MKYRVRFTYCYEIKANDMDVAEDMAWVQFLKDSWMDPPNEITVEEIENGN